VYIENWTILLVGKEVGNNAECNAKGKADAGSWKFRP
jgi:hypothetical protein